MKDEGKALADRLVAVVGWRKLTGLVSTEGSVFFYERTDLEENPVGIFITKGCGEIYARLADGETIDLDHPSNEGHLRLLAEEVCGEVLALTSRQEGRWLAEGPYYWGRGPTPGQAYTAAIVAAKEQG
jgi:hypothetical protein